ncbi:MAG: chalcone isomerase family protein [Rhodocyclaceae bacterium]|jgi:hypothetical protein|nr:chalcone isomerase family protein [Rhodocyclaceae bacterium]MCA3132899.1 chalcone isomerase family protein [Rhodocyclaceae bacterium]MCA3147275.1 chalcone isomerase family protein [Rhodocyclaceae bacterium]MCE2896770.1 chalcone isomerase family protein [Betaproteobacteria bacterium]
MLERTSRWLAGVALAVAILCAEAAGLAPLPESLATGDNQYRVLGSGRMRWFGLHLYDAALWVSGREHGWDQSFVLDIRYARDFYGARIAEASADEIRRLGSGDPRRIDSWREQMARIFPDVRKGEHITGVFRPGLGAEFFYQGRPLGTVYDADFARAFFSIWLDPRTREPKLRAALLGQR